MARRIVILMALPVVEGSEVPPIPVREGPKKTIAASAACDLAAREA